MDNIPRILNLLTEAHLLWSRLRGPQVIMRGSWSPHGNPEFGRCKWCGGMRLRGICQACGMHADCAWCGKVEQGDGTWARVPHLDEVRPSHGMCHDCRHTFMIKCRETLPEYSRAEFDLKVKALEAE